MEKFESLLQELQIQNVESQSFGIKALTELFLDCEFTGDITLMRFHLQVLKQNQNLLQNLLDQKLQF